MTSPQPAVLPAHPATFAALAVPNFRRYVSGQALSLIGTWVETVAQALLVLQLTHSGTILGLTTAARYAPILLLSPYAGLLVDRYAKRHVLLGTQAGLGLVSAVLGVAVLTGEIRLWQVVALGVLFGILSAVDNPARQAFVQEVVGHDLVRNAVTLNTTTVNVARVIGPTIAAVLVSTVGIGWCFVVNAASFGFVIVSLLSLDTRRLHPVPPVPRGRGQLRAGLRFAAGVPAIIRPLLMMALVGTFTFEFEVSLIAASLLEASARDALGEREATGRALERGLDLAEPDGLLFPFLLYPAPELLERHARQRAAYPALIWKIISMLGGRRPAAPAGAPPQHLPEPLSQAEARVLRFLQTSLSAPEIARELYVSVNTVRTHMRHLYDKLGAHRRLEALDRARALGLLAPVPQRALTFTSMT